MSAIVVLSVMPRSFETKCTDGAKIVEAKGEMKQKAPIMAVARIFLLNSQAYGFIRLCEFRFGQL